LSGDTATLADFGILPDTGERYLSTVLYAFDEYPL